jgi:chemotaxis protein CheD
MMKDLPIQGIRLSIHPGEWYFGNEYDSFYTVLGSCVALTAWHPKLRIGGLCHYLLPVPPGNQSGPDLMRGEGVGRYAKTALAAMQDAMLRYAPLMDYQLGLFGGSDTLSNYGIGKQNIVYAQHWLADRKLSPHETDLGGTFSRSLVMDMEQGAIHIKHYAMSLSGTPPQK